MHLMDVQFLDVKAITYIEQHMLLILRLNRRTRVIFLAECPASLVGRTGIYETSWKLCYIDSLFYIPKYFELLLKLNVS